MPNVELREIPATDRVMIHRIGELRIRTWQTEVPQAAKMLITAPSAWLMTRRIDMRPENASEIMGEPVLLSDIGLKCTTEEPRNAG